MVPVTGVAGVYPGWCGWVVREGYYPGTLPSHPRTPILVIFSHRALPTAK